MKGINESRSSIYKYAMEISVLPNVFDIPMGAEFLSLSMQQGKVAMWFLVDLDQETHETREFYILGTGHKFDSTMIGKEDYMGTTIDKQLVWHIFEKRG